jgi:putative FmdB family regulatory protein
MPYYDLICDDCHEPSNLKATIRERSERLLTCPACGSKNLSTVYRQVNVLRFHNKDCDVCPGASGRPTGGCCGGACAHNH